MLAESEITKDEAKDYLSELYRCYNSPTYFIENYVYIFDKEIEQWVLFKLWDFQQELVFALNNALHTVILKARQNGVSFVIYAYFVIWYCVFHRNKIVHLFHQKQTTARKALRNRVKIMLDRLPDWMQLPQQIITNRGKRDMQDSSQTLEFANGSRIETHSKVGDRGDIGGIIIVDEADHVEDCGKILSDVKPELGQKGKIIMISTSNKSRPDSPFKINYKQAKAGNLEDWQAFFYSWNINPLRDQAWYEKEKTDWTLRNQDKSPDVFYGEYPATDTEALAPMSTNRYFTIDELQPVTDIQDPLEYGDFPPLPQTYYWEQYIDSEDYVIGIDSAKAQSDHSDLNAAIVLKVSTGEMVAMIHGRIPLPDFIEYIDIIARYYGKASIMPENNSIGFTIISEFEKYKDDIPLLKGWDKKPGWTSSAGSEKGKRLLYLEARKAVRAQEVTIRSQQVINQLVDVDDKHLRAKELKHEDLADAFCLAVVGINEFIKYEPSIGIHF